MTSIAVIGANGRVGTEVTLLLSLAEGVDVIPIVRSAYAGSFLRRLGVTCRVGSVSDPSVAPELLAGADLVVDFSLPGGLPSQVKLGMRANMRGILEAAPPGAAYVFISSTMAYGTDPQGRYQDFLISRTAYSALKRYGERRARVLGRLKSRPVSVLRLGEVHGDLQPVSHDVQKRVRRARDGIALPFCGDVASDVVQCGTIAGTLVQLASSRIDHGVFTVVEEPPVTLRALYERHAQAIGKTLKIGDAGVGGSPTISSRLGRVLSQNRDFLTAHVLPDNQAVEVRLRGPHHVRSAGAQLAAVEQSRYVVPTHRFGTIPGRRPELPSAVRHEMKRAERALRHSLHERLGERAHLFPVEQPT